MTSISQNIPNYTGGISEQADERKFPGQVVDSINAIPDATYGLYKRPGSKRVGTTPLASVASGGSWFHYYRDETEGSYIGQVQSDGTLNVWRCSDGTKMTTVYGTGGQTAIQNYLKTDITATYTRSGTTVTVTSTGHNLNTGDVIIADFTGAATDGTYTITSTGNNTFTLIDSASGTITSTAMTYIKKGAHEDLQFLTINDTTFVNNRDTTVAVTGTTPGKIDNYYAYIEILRTENGRQYALNIYDTETATARARATRMKIASNNLETGAGTGRCPGIGTQVFQEGKGAKTGVDSANAKNLIFRITTLGQQGRSEDNTDSDNPGHHACAYNSRIDLLHGGEGWDTDDETTVTLNDAQGKNYTYTVKVTDHESISSKGTINGGVNGIIRPTPTPFDADTAVTIDTILGGITDALSGTGVNYRVIGNGLYLYSANEFNVEILNQDLMRVMQTKVNDVSLLPSQCRHGYLVQVSNSQDSDDDDYWLKFNGENNEDGPGAWEEVAAPGIDLGFNLATMPHVIQRTAATTFTVKQFSYPNREVGDDETNPKPSFVTKKINKVLFFRNRLAFLSGENVITCQAGTLGAPNFWAKTAIAVSASDPIDISSSSMFPSDLYDGIDINAGLLVFSSNQQFLLSSDDTILNPDTAKLRSVAAYNYNIDMPPISLGMSVGYIDNSGKYSRFNEMINVSREGEPMVGETSKLVPSLLPKDLDLITNSRENQLVLFGKTNSDIVYGFKYFQLGDKRQQAAWFKWKLNNPIKYHFIVDDDYYFLDTDDFLQKMSIVQSDTDVSIDQDNVNYLIHLDNWTTVGNGSYNATTKVTTFANQSDWIDNVSTPNGALVIVDTDSGATRVGRYAECTVTNTDDFTVPGDWSTGTFYIGYLYEYNIKLPTIYTTKSEGQRTVADVNSSLIIHRINLSLGKIGLYETTLERKGKADYSEVYESSLSDEYEASDAPYLSEKIKTIPVYEKNKNVDIVIKSSHPSPTTLHSMSWEGDYSPMFYQRV